MSDPEHSKEADEPEPTPSPDEPEQSDFVPLPADYLIRQQQLATYEILCQFLIHGDKNLACVLNEIRVSLDCLTKSVIQLNKHISTLKNTT